MRIAFAGTPDVAIPSLRALLAADHEVAAVITRPDAPAGRGRVLTPSPIADFAIAHGLRVFKPARLAEIEAEIRALGVDCIPVVAYGGLVPSNLLDVPTYGWVNLHFSLLPAWRGAAPIQRAVMSGDEYTGASVFRLVAELDAGPVFETIERPITPSDTSGTLLTALAEDGADLLTRVVDGIAHRTPTPQSVHGITYAAKLTKADARIDWSQDSAVIDRRIRGCTPEPGAWTAIEGERIGVAPVGMRADLSALPAGRVNFGDAVLVGTGTHPVALEAVKPAGKDWMTADAWARGLRVKPEQFDVD